MMIAFFFLWTVPAYGYARVARRLPRSGHSTTSSTLPEADQRELGQEAEPHAEEGGRQVHRDKLNEKTRVYDVAEHKDTEREQPKEAVESEFHSDAALESTHFGGTNRREEKNHGGESPTSEAKSDGASSFSENLDAERPTPNAKRSRLDRFRKKLQRYITKERKDYEDMCGLFEIALEMTASSKRPADFSNETYEDYIATKIAALGYKMVDDLKPTQLELLRHANRRAAAAEKHFAGFPKLLQGILVGQYHNKAFPFRANTSNAAVRAFLLKDIKVTLVRSAKEIFTNAGGLSASGNAPSDISQPPTTQTQAAFLSLLSSLDLIRGGATQEACSTNETGQRVISTNGGVISPSLPEDEDKNAL